MNIKVVRGDITKQEVDAIVNAGNNMMMGGGGVDGAIHRAAGPGLLLECRDIGWCETGDCKVTSAYNLPCKWVLHTAGPVWFGGAQNVMDAIKEGRPQETMDKEDAQLASCYRRCLEEAVRVGARTVAFPSISTGAYGFPIRRAAGIAHRAVNDFLDGTDAIDQVVFVCWERDDYNAHLEVHG